MREVHIRQPIWNGDRSICYVGIARKRVVDDLGKACRGNIRVWIDYKETDTQSPMGWKLVYPYPFDIKCADVLNYPKQILNDYNHTILYIIPISDLREVKNYRQGSARGRSITQADFESIKIACAAVKAEQNIKKEQPE